MLDIVLKQWSFIFFKLFYQFPIQLRLTSVCIISVTRYILEIAFPRAKTNATGAFFIS